MPKESEVPCGKNASPFPLPDSAPPPARAPVGVRHQAQKLVGHNLGRAGGTVPRRTKRFHSVCRGDVLSLAPIGGLGSVVWSCSRAVSVEPRQEPDPQTNPKTTKNKLPDLLCSSFGGTLFDLTLQAKQQQWTKQKSGLELPTCNLEELTAGPIIRGVVPPEVMNPH